MFRRTITTWTAPATLAAGSARCLPHAAARPVSATTARAAPASRTAATVAAAATALATA
jgi:hypothetical protein